MLCDPHPFTSDITPLSLLQEKADDKEESYQMPWYGFHPSVHFSGSARLVSEIR